jgi:hypothetical protein
MQLMADGLYGLTDGWMSSAPAAPLITQSSYTERRRLIPPSLLRYTSVRDVTRCQQQVMCWAPRDRHSYMRLQVPILVIVSSVWIVTLEMRLDTRSCYLLAQQINMLTTVWFGSRT